MSKNDSFSGKFLTAGEFQEFISGELDGDSDIRDHAGHSDNIEEIKLLNRFSMLYDGEQHPKMPLDFKDTAMGEMFRSHFGTMTASRKIDEGNVNWLKFHTGLQDHQNDASGITSLINLKENIIDVNGYIGYIYGTTGTGKTTFAGLTSELAKRLSDYEIATNIRSFVKDDQADHYIWTFGDVLQWLSDGTEIDELQDIERQNIDVDLSNKLLVFDEASNYASGYASDASDAQEKLGKSVKLFRKVNANLLIIGHTGKDVHPDIRRLSDHIIFKPEQKMAIFYDSINEGKGQNEQFREGNLPRPNWQFRDKEITFWSWRNKTSGELEGMKDAMKNKAERIIDCMKENPNATQAQIADKVGCQQSYVSQVQTQLQKEVEQARGQADD